MSIKKCPHGTYIPEGDDVAWYCQHPDCNPWFPELPWDARNLHLPDGNHPRALDNKRMKATRSSVACPECQSYIHEQLEGRQRRCGECGKEYRGPRVVIAPEAEEVTATWME